MGTIQVKVAYKMVENFIMKGKYFYRINTYYPS